jgi:hypothetical protein
MNIPSDVMPCHTINEEQRLQAIRDGKPFQTFETNSYFRIKNRIDNRFIEGYICRKDLNFSYVNNVYDPYTYLRDFFERKKVYFTFDSITLYELVEWYPNHPHPLLFILKRIDAKIYKSNQAFMIMPFNKIDLDDFYTSSIRPFLKEKLGITIYRADDFRNNDIIVETIYKLIEESEVIIADTTLENKNAFYELGYAAAIGKEIITIQNIAIEKKLFFDRVHIRSIFYDLDTISIFQEELGMTIQSIRARL